MTIRIVYANWQASEILGDYTEKNSKCAIIRNEIIVVTCSAVKILFSC